jgi:hypothetical protein
MLTALIKVSSPFSGRSETWAFSSFTETAAETAEDSFEESCGTTTEYATEEVFVFSKYFRETTATEKNAAKTTKSASEIRFFIGRIIQKLKTIFNNHSP